MRPKFRVLTVLAAALMGFITGGVLDNKPTDRGVLVPTGYQDVARDFPLPHHVPQYVGGLSFRFAMIHDVLHERFEKHGAAWYEHRNRLNQQRLETLTETDRSRWPIIDDLAAGMDRMGQPGEAVKLMRQTSASAGSGAHGTGPLHQLRKSRHVPDPRQCQGGLCR